jgi:glucoamylase
LHILYVTALPSNTMFHRRWDLWWAPVWAGSYWTSSVQYRALRAGARLCRLIGRETDDHTYAGVASSVLEYSQESALSPPGFWKTETLQPCRRSGTQRKDL